MLMAIAHGKARRLKKALNLGERWRSVFQGSEDLLTAAVFARLSYLEPSEFWRTLKAATDSDYMPDGGQIELVSIDFWPRWELGESYKEPDVYLSFRIDDALFDFIIEAKLDAVQTAAQWEQEYRAYLENVQRDDRRVALIAVGGSGGMFTPSFVENIRALSFEWNTLFNVVRERLKSPDIRMRDKRILDDIITACGFHGYRHWESLEELPNIIKNWTKTTKDSFAALSPWHDFRSGELVSSDHQLTNLSDLIDLTQRIRPIKLPAVFRERMK